MTTIFRRYVDDPSTAERELAAHSGQSVEKIGPVLEADEAEGIPMQQIRFADGYTDVAFLDELHEEPCPVCGFVHPYIAHWPCATENPTNHND